MATKKVPFKKLARTITGISTPIFGVSWNPPEDKRDVVRDLVTFLEDRRALFQEYCREYGPWVIDSVLEMRKELTAALKRCADDADLAGTLRAMRAACRKFLDQMDPSGQRIHRPFGYEPAMWTALGELRALFGLHLARLSVAYGVDVEPELASIFPKPDTERKPKK